MPRIERLTQRTPEWQRWRRGGIGASDAAPVLGNSPFLSARTLWAIKTGQLAEPPDNPATRRGRALEALARRAYERHTGVQMEPLCVTHSERSWMRASLDGLSFDFGLVLEIKCPLNSSDRLLADQGRVPEHYYAQLQHQLEVTGAAEAHYWSFDGVRGALVTVKPNPAFIERLVEAERNFWQRVVERSWPTVLVAELDLSCDPNWRAAGERYRSAKAALDDAEAAERQARGRLAALATACRTVGSGIELIRSERRGAVDYAKVPELRGVDLEPYRKPPVEVVRINLLTQA